MNTRENLIFRPRPDIIRLLILGVTVLAFSPAPFCGSDIQAGTAPQILYVEKGENSQNFLAVINQDGTGGKRVSKGFFFIVSPRTCRAHDIIVFTVHNEAMKTSVHLLYPDGRSEKVIENAAAHNWSPDGKAILYSPSGEECDLFSYTLSTKSSERMTKGKQIMEACWSPDMKKIALSIMEKNGSFDLYL
jgi:Tol biopolymer transport system component